jgi:hypothetical protein
VARIELVESFVQQRHHRRPLGAVQLPDYPLDLLAELFWDLDVDQLTEDADVLEVRQA